MQPDDNRSGLGPEANGTGARTAGDAADSRSVRTAGGQELRELARDLLRRGEVPVPTLGSEDMSRLAQELQVAYAELEVQFRQIQETQRRLSGSEARYRALFEDAPNGHAVVDAHGQIERANRTLGRWFGRRPFELVGIPLVAYVATRSQSTFVGFIQSVLEQAEREACDEIEIECRAASGEDFPVVVRGSVVPGESAFLSSEGADPDDHERGVDPATARSPSDGGNGRRSGGSDRRVLLSFVDLSRRRVLEARLQQSQKLESLGILAGGIAHDFNNTLQIVRGYAELLLAADLDAESRAEMLGSILKASERARQITGQIQMFSRRQMLRPEIVNLATAVGETLQLLRPLLGDDVVARYRPTERELPVRLDAGQLGQLVMNLAANARDAMPDGGLLLIETDHRVIGAAEAAGLPGCRAGEYALLRVVDEGCGISEQDLRRIFDPFFTTKDIGHGTGMGLASVYGIVQRAGGSVDVESRLGHGSEFRVLLPLCFEEQGRQADELATVPDALEGRRVLLVDDSDEVRAVATSMLVRRGFEVEPVGDPAAALEMVRADPDRFDVVLSDVVMPGMSGFELASRIAAVRASLPTVFISGHTRDEIGARAPAFAELTIVPKPFSGDDLLRGISVALCGKGGS